MGELSVLGLWRVLSTAPSKCLGLSPGEIRPQKLAEVISCSDNQL
ncbi:hypothetical protein [Okeania sp. SIO3I5]